jgi:hypothetical protein
MNAGDERAAEGDLAGARDEYAAHGKLRELVPRLPAAGLLPEDAELIGKLVDAGK